MATVTGDIGGQPVQLDNAATESTLRELVSAITLMAAKAGGAKSQADVEKELKKYAESLKKANKLQDDGNDASKKQAKLDENLRKETQNMIRGFDMVGRSAANLTRGMTDLMTGFADMGNSLTAAARSLSAIPVVGGTLSTVFGAVAGAAEKSYKSFQQSASVGANFGGSISDMINSASGAGLTIDQFSGIIAKNSESLILLGGSTDAGAKRLADLGKGIKNSKVGDELARMGYSTEEINAGMATYAGRLAKTGALKSMSDKELIASTGSYLQNLDAVSKLTGKSKEALMAEEDARMKDAQYLALKNQLDRDSQQQLEMLMSSIPKEMQAGAKEVLATGTATSQAGRDFIAFMNRSGTDAAVLNRTMMVSGKLSAQERIAFDRSLRESSKEFVKNGRVQAQFGTDSQKSLYVGASTLAGQQKTAADIENERQQLKEKENKALRDGLDPASMKRYQEQIAATSNQFIKLLATSGALEGMMTVFQTLATITETIVAPAFGFLARNLVPLSIMIAPLAGALLYLKVMTYKTALAEAFKGKVTMATMLPFIKIGLVVGGLYMVFKSLYDHGWSLGDVFEALGDNLKRFGIEYVDIWLSIAEKIANVFGKGDAVRAARQNLQLEREELDQKEKARDTRRKTTAQERKLSDDSNSAKQKEIDLTKESTKTTEAKIATGKNYDNTIDLLRGTKAGGGTATPSAAGPVSSSSDMQKYLQATALIESGGNANARAGTSSAGGMFQFIDSTWTQMTKEMGKNYSLQDKFDPKKSAEVMEYFTQKQKAQLEKGTGRAASNTDLYMAHFLGAGGATKFLNAKNQDPNQSAAMLDPKAAAANKSIYYDKGGKERSVQEVYDLMAKKMGGAEQALASGKWGGKAIPAEVAALQGQIGSQGTSVAATASTPAPSQTAASAPAQTQETPVSLLASLNTKMDQLIKINKDQHSTSERQLTAQRSQSNDLYVAA